MRRVLLGLGVGLWVMTSGCESRRPIETAAVATPENKSLPVAAPIAASRPAPPDTADCTRARPGPSTSPADTLVAVGSRHCWLTINVQTDSSKAIYATSEGTTGPAFAPPADTVGGRWTGRVRGYEETYTFTLRDSTRRRVLLRQVLHKPDFWGVESREVVTVMNLERPDFVGYSAALNALVFVCHLGIPYSDVGSRATLVLDLNGRGKRLYNSGAELWGGANCDPQLSPSGHYVLTCDRLLRPGRPPLMLEKPRASLHAARFLNDSTLLVVYEHGEFRPRPSIRSKISANETAPMTEADFVVTPAQRRLPTALLLTASGRLVGQFNLRTGGMTGSELPRTFVKPALTYIFYEDNQQIVLVPKTRPAGFTVLPLKKAPEIQAPGAARRKEVHN